MRRNLILITVLLLVLILLLSWTTTENFDSTIATLNNDRTNPIAAVTNPLRNPAIPIGISAAEAAKQRTMYAAIFGGAKPEGFEGTAGITPLISDENSFLGLTKFCQENGSGDTPFNNPKFAANCGVCVSEGTTILLDANGRPTRFTTPTGVLVYKADKDRALGVKAPFPRVVPSLNSGTCVGASLGGDAKPVLAITQKDLVAFKKRIACQKNHTLEGTLGKECGICTNPNVYTYVPSDGDINPISIILWGTGTVTVFLDGRVIQANGASAVPDATGKVPPTVLSGEKALIYSLGSAREGALLEIDVVKTTDLNLYGVLQTTSSVSTSPTTGIYRLPLERFIENDKASGSPPRYLLPRYFTDVKRSLKKIVPSNNLSTMHLTGSIPVTLVQSDQLASYDCPAAPLMTLNASADMLIDDPCRKPKDQSAGNYTDECLQDALTSAGCSVEGDWYAKVKDTAGSRSVGEFIAWVKAQLPKVKTDANVAKGCLGNDITTPCDAYKANPNAVPSAACLAYIYKKKGTREGFSNMDTPLCSADGRLNPETAEGKSRLETIASTGYKNLKGLAAVELYLNDARAKALDVRADVNKGNAQGGRSDSWDDCIGLHVEPPVIGDVGKLASGAVKTYYEPPPPCSSQYMPTSYSPRQNVVIGYALMRSANYSLSFSINPAAYTPSGRWGNIIRFRDQYTQFGDCCTPGQRSPAIWFFPDQSMHLHVRIGDMTDGNWGINTNDPPWNNSKGLPLRQSTKVNLECKDRAVTLTVGDRVYRATQPTTRARSSWYMQVWGGDPWYIAPQAQITDLCYREI